MRLIPYKGPRDGFKGFGISRDQRVKSLRVVERQILPAISSSDLPPGDLHGEGGALAYDVDTQRPYFSNGTTWTPISSMATGTAVSYAFLLGADLSVPTGGGEVRIPDWSVGSSSVYHTIPEWDLTQGIYTSTQDESLSLAVNVSWLGGVSNLGERTLRVQFRSAFGGSWTTIKEVSTQADPDAAVATTQECQINVKLASGNQIRVAVTHDAPVDLTIASGTESTISGFQVCD